MVLCFCCVSASVSECVNVYDYGLWCMGNVACLHVYVYVCCVCWLVLVVLL